MKRLLLGSILLGLPVIGLAATCPTISESQMNLRIGDNSSTFSGQTSEASLQHVYALRNSDGSPREIVVAQLERQLSNNYNLVVTRHTVGAGNNCTATTPQTFTNAVIPPAVASGASATSFTVRLGNNVAGHLAVALVEPNKTFRGVEDATITTLRFANNAWRVSGRDVILDTVPGKTPPFVATRCSINMSNGRNERYGVRQSSNITIPSGGIVAGPNLSQTISMTIGNRCNANVSYESALNDGIPQRPPGCNPQQLNANETAHCVPMNPTALGPDLIGKFLNPQEDEGGDDANYVHQLSGGDYAALTCGQPYVATEGGYFTGFYMDPLTTGTAFNGRFVTEDNVQQLLSDVLVSDLSCEPINPPATYAVLCRGTGTVQAGSGVGQTIPVNRRLTAAQWAQLNASGRLNATTDENTSGDGVTPADGNIRANIFSRSGSRWQLRVRVVKPQPEGIYMECTVSSEGAEVNTSEGSREVPATVPAGGTGGAANDQ